MHATHAESRLADPPSYVDWKNLTLIKAALIKHLFSKPETLAKGLFSKQEIDGVLTVEHACTDS